MMYTFEIVKRLEWKILSLEELHATILSHTCNDQDCVKHHGDLLVRIDARIRFYEKQLTRFNR